MGGGSGARPGGREVWAAPLRDSFAFLKNLLLKQMGASEEFYTRSDRGFIRINPALGGRVSELGGGEAAHWPGNQDKG